MNKQIAVMLPFIFLILLSGGIVSALNSEDASSEVSFSSSAPHPGGTLVFRVTFKVSASTQQVQIQRVGVNFDWMDEDFFAGKTYSNLQSVTSDTIFVSDPISVQIPINVSVGSHSYFVGVDGVDASGNFYWSSPKETIQVTYSNTQTTTPSPTVNPDGDEQTEGTPNFLTVLVVVSVVAIVIAVAVIFMELRKKPKQVNPVAEKANPLPDHPQRDNYDI